MEGGKAAHHHDTARLLKAFTRTVEPRNFGIGLVAGFLLVTCAYFSTARFDAIHIAPLVSPSETRIGSPATAAAAGSKSQLDLGVPEQTLSREGSKAEVLDTDSDDGAGNKDLVHDASLADTKKDDTFARDGDAAAAVEAAKDDDDAAGALLPPLSANGTQEEQGVLEDQELLVPDALAAANSPNKSGNNGGSQPVVQSDPATIPAPVQQTPPTTTIPEAPKHEEAKAPPAQQIPLVPEPLKQQPGPEEVATAPRREWKPLCDMTSNRRIDWCELDGDVRVHGAKATVTMVGAARAEEWRIRPYPRKVDPNAMRHVTNITVRSTMTLPGAGAGEGECAIKHSVPALLFSDRGYTGNYFHAYTDVILPLFLTAKQYGGEVQLLVSDMQMWWIGKFLPVFKSLSNYDLVDLAADNRTRCFRHVQVGLTCHADFSIDPLRAPNGYSMVDFTKHMRGVYGLPRGLAVPAAGARPRLLLIARASTRRFVNADDIVRAAQKVGFEVVVSEGTHEVAPFAELANTCDVMLGVHGAGLTNMVFLPTGGVVIQVVPLGGLEFVVGYFRAPSRDMGLKYLEYRIAPAESTLTEQYPADHPIFTDPDGVKSKGWESLKQVYLDKQDVRLDLKRFRPLLKKAIAHIRANKLQH
ncbi:beta-1,2-xylosyltransferase XYXT1-like [Triticum dicoccoides]|uniref:beta-1,2-xylosyltransferase XYXT1-like n=1 Tax=Triticum dicoccoides TaxID=85692 RepID=UPI00188FC5A8|nr:beta-1,2-xylosyltransferase XYXT1-like [Triticum dicoccoides]